MYHSHCWKRERPVLKEACNFCEDGVEVDFEFAVQIKVLIYVNGGIYGTGVIISFHDFRFAESKAIVSITPCKVFEQMGG